MGNVFFVQWLSGDKSSSEVFGKLINDLLKPNDEELPYAGNL